MAKDIAITSSVVAQADLTDEARGYARASKSDNTRRAYGSLIKRWTAYCEQVGLDPFPADPSQVANWIALRAKDGAAYATLRTAIAAIRAGHIAKGLAFNSQAPTIESVMRGIGRVHAKVQAQAEPVRSADLVDILARLPDTPVGLRDGTVMALGYAFGLRRSELVGLDWFAQGAGDGFLKIDAKQVSVTLARSKTGRVGEVETVTIPRQPVASIVALVERWLRVAAIEEGTPILRALTKGENITARRLDAQSVSLIVKRRVADHHEANGVSREMAQREASKYSGHSLRVGFAITAAEAGATAEEIALVTRHRSLEMPRRYAAKADALRRSPYRRAGVGTDAGGRLR